MPLLLGLLHVRPGPIIIMDINNLFSLYLLLQFFFCPAYSGLVARGVAGGLVKLWQHSMPSFFVAGTATAQRRARNAKIRNKWRRKIEWGNWLTQIHLEMTSLA